MSDRILRVRRFAFFLALSICLTVSQGWSATVTVGSSGTYPTIADAANDFGNWGNGSGDTIRLNSTETHTIADRISFTFGLSGDQTFTIESDNPSANAVILHATNATGAMRFGTAGTWNLNNLTFLPAIGSDFTGSERGTIQLEDGLVAPNVYDLNITGCIFTANNGSNQPNLTFGVAASAPRPGIAVRHGDGSNPSGVNLTMTDCIIAHTVYAALYFARNTDEFGMNGNAGPMNCVFDGVLIQRPGEDALRIRNHNPGDIYTLQNSAILDGQNGSAIQVAKGDENPTEGMGVFTIDNCIISHPGGNQISLRQNFVGTLIVNDTTIYFPPNNVGIRYEDFDVLQSGEERHLTVTDSIINTGDQAIRINVNFPGAEFTSVNINNFATAGTTPYGNDNTVDVASVVNAINAVYGGAGPLMDDPQFVSTDYAVVTSADSTTNDFLDIQTTSYGTAASGGGPLEGGAQYVGEQTDVENWALY